ncbi:MAG: hypothetical protein HYU67_12820 [Flavobacteriia bacterium]|nr:hypothetical protein [Flavobacteriia bacterium]
MQKIAGKYLLIFALFLNSCTLKEVTYTGVDGFKAGKFQNKELDFSINLKIKNDNGFNIKIKPGHLDVLLEDHKIADLYLENKLKFKGNSEESHFTQWRVKLADGAMMSLLKIRPGNKIDLRFKGTIKAKAMGFGKNIEIDEKQNLDLSLLKLLKIF